MRIGIDARFLTHPQFGGFKTYTVNLIEALGSVDKNNQYVLYLDRQPSSDDAPIPRSPNFVYRVIPADLPLIGMPLREQVLLGWQIAKDQLDIVHFLCNTASVRAIGTYIVTLHDTIQLTSSNPFSLLKSPTEHKRWAMLAYSKWAINGSVRKADRIVTVSEFEKGQIVRQLAIDPDRVSVTHLAPNSIYKPASPEEKRSWRAKLPALFGIKKKFVMGVGYEPRKNIQILIESFVKIASKFEDLDLVIVCADETRRINFQQLAGKFNLDGRVIILGSLPAKELLILYNLAECFVYPSERESFGLPPLEAFACGTPTIAMNMTSMPEVLGDGALMIDGKDVEIWANATERVLMDDGLRSSLIRRGLERASRLTWRNCALNTIQVYESVCQ